jgi:hypothetical protein
MAWCGSAATNWLRIRRTARAPLGRRPAGREGARGLTSTRRGKVMRRNPTRDLRFAPSTAACADFFRQRAFGGRAGSLRPCATRTRSFVSVRRIQVADGGRWRWVGGQVVVREGGRASGRAVSGTGYGAEPESTWPACCRQCWFPKADHGSRTMPRRDAGWQHRGGFGSDHGSAWHVPITTSRRYKGATHCVAGELVAGELVAGELVAGELVAGKLVAGELVAVKSTTVFSMRA